MLLRNAQTKKPKNQKTMIFDENSKLPVAVVVVVVDDVVAVVAVVVVAVA